MAAQTIVQCDSSSQGLVAAEHEITLGALSVSLLLTPPSRAAVGGLFVAARAPLKVPSLLDLGARRQAILKALRVEIIAFRFKSNVIRYEQSPDNLIVR